MESEQNTPQEECHLQKAKLLENEHPGTILISHLLPEISFNLRTNRINMNQSLTKKSHIVTEEYPHTHTYIYI